MASVKSDRGKSRPLRQPRPTLASKTRKRKQNVQPEKARSQLSLESFARLDRSAVILLVFLLCLSHWAIRVFIAPVYTIEEADQLLMSQSFQLGYDARQPPMIAWVHAMAAAWPGLSGPVVFAIKYALLFVALTFYYLSARNVLTKPAASAAAVGAWALTFVVGWAIHEDLIVGVALMASLSLTLHALTRILTWRRNRDWFYLGLSLGLGLLTHHLFIVLPLALFFATFLSPFFREAMKPMRLVGALLVAAAIYSPYAVWLTAHPDRIAEIGQDVAATWEIDGGWLERAGAGAVSLARTLLQFSLPLSLFWLTLFWTMWLPVLYPVFARRSTDEEQHEAAWRALFARAMLIGAAIFVVGVLIGVQSWKSYWILPALYTGPLWMFLHVKRAGEFPVAIRAFAALAIALVGAVAAGRFVEWRLEIETCEEGGCRPYAPIAAWAEELRSSGFEAGTIVGADPHLTGNLRGAMLEARVMDASLPADSFPPAVTRGACLAVWRETLFDAERKVAVMPAKLASYLNDELRSPPHDLGADGAIRRNLTLSKSKSATLYFQFVPPSDACR